jgi:hypothetical protein
MLQLYFDINPRRKIQFHQRIHRLLRWLKDVEQSLVGSHFELLTRFFVNVGRTQNAKLIDPRRQRYRPHNLGAGFCRRINNVRSRLVKQLEIVCLEPYPDLGICYHSL